MGEETIPAEMAAVLEQTWRSLGVSLEDARYEGDRLSTTADMSRAAPEDDELPPLLAPPIQLTLGAPLGEGGMGIVRAGVQVALRREVAIKSMRPDARRVDALVREARVLGGLEHPNIVPVHLLGRDEERRPLLAMKRVDGVPWTDLLEDDPPTSGASLRRHVEILRAVTRAVRFAHARGVLHRDVKPDNVMIGAFGEVYLMDWGIAARLDHEGALDAGLPRVSEVRAIEGTPVYMAPEMAAGDGRAIDERSDVYLLGATLHHVLTGSPPHVGPTLHALLVSAFESTPRDYPAAVPDELVQILRRAMNRDSDARFASAGDLDVALEAFLTHEGSRELVDEGLKRLERARTTSGIERDDVLREARFAFEQALRSWPGNERARRELRALFETRVRDALAEGVPAVAQAWLREHDAPPSELVAAVERALVEADSKAKRLASLERDADPRIGVETRVLRAWTSGLGWVVLCLTFGWLGRSGTYEVTPHLMAALALVFLVGDLAWVYRTRDTLYRHAKNRRLLWAGTMIFGLSAILWPLLAHAGVSMPHTSGVLAFVNGAIWSVVALEFGRSWFTLPLAHLPAAIGAWFLPEWHFELFAVAGLSAIWVAHAMRATTSSDEASSTSASQRGSSD